MNCFFFFFFFQAEDGIRDNVAWLEFRRVLFRSLYSGRGAVRGVALRHARPGRDRVGAVRSEERRVGKSVLRCVDLGGRRIIKKKKKKTNEHNTPTTPTPSPHITLPPP